MALRDAVQPMNGWAEVIELHVTGPLEIKFPATRSIAAAHSTSPASSFRPKRHRAEYPRLSRVANQKHASESISTVTPVVQPI